MNNTFNIKCIRADPQAGICDSKESCCPEFSQNIIMPDPMVAILSSGVVQNIGSSCVLNMTFQVTAVSPYVAPTVIGTVPVGFLPTSPVTTLGLGLPSFSFDSIMIATNGDISLLGMPGFITQDDFVSICVAYPC